MFQEHLIHSAEIAGGKITALSPQAKGVCVMYAGKDFHSLPLSPDDLELLKGILGSELQARRITCESEQADDLARRLIELFQSGVRNPDALRKIIMAV